MSLLQYSKESNHHTTNLD